MKILLPEGASSTFYFTSKIIHAIAVEDEVQYLKFMGKLVSSLKQNQDDEEAKSVVILFKNKNFFEIRGMH